ncbi:MAG: DNA polymerase III subunit delta [Bacillota bacterium]|nr:DNA polymerase III subunit delta [Bacillota bacterium]
MAYKAKKTEAHAFQKIEKALKEGTLKSPLIFYGREQYLVDWAVGAIEEKYVSPACRELDLSRPEPETLSFSVLQECCETLPLFSEKRLVVISQFAPLRGQGAKGFSKEDEGQLAEYFQKLPESCILVFTAEQVDKRLKLYKAAEAAGAAYDFTVLSEDLLRGFIHKRLRKAGKTAAPAVVEQLMSMSGYYEKDGDYTLYNLENDIRKAVAHATGEELRLQDVADTVSGNLDTDVFALVDALSRHRKDAAFQKLQDLLRSGANHYQLLALICSQFELLLKLKEMRDEGMSLETIRERLGVHEFRLRKAAGFGDRYTAPQLRRILCSAYDVDRNIKDGFLEPSLALEMFVAEI